MNLLIAVSFEVSLFFCIKHFFKPKNEHSLNCFVSLALKFPIPFLYK